ncbi:penicillin-binding protein [Actinoalloteichus caeruleus]|uniref:penicillin-binding protein n=1 Tax=Actinoalloteichus cyanogriseus TaxID=2893586 RepID=UPI003AAE0729
MRFRAGVLKLFGLCVLAGVLAAGVLFPAVGGLGVASNQASDTVDSLSADLVTTDPPLVSTITDSEGDPIAYLFDQYRVLVEPHEIADSMKAAIIAVEDQRFYQHEGVDWRGTFRAAVTNQMSGSIAQGGSTLTQQYVKNYLVHVVAADSPAEQAKAIEQTPARKLREIRIALQLEQNLDKEEILAGYLNIVPFGNQTYGVGAAARTYFNTTADQLTVPQAALLAGIVNSPGSLNPERNPEEAKRRRNIVIGLMAEQGHISEEAAEEAKREPLGLAQPLGRPPNDCVGAGPSDGFFCEYVIDYLASAGFSKDQLKRGGYTIRTTLDHSITEMAKRAAEDQVPKTTEGIANAMAVVEPGHDGHKVRALVANRDYGLDPEAGQTMYPLPSGMTMFGAGSIYKTFTAAAALEAGMGIQNEVDVPTTHVSSVYFNNGAPYQVSNDNDGYPARMTLQDALAKSPNTSFVALQERVGLDAVVDMAERLGLRQGMTGINHQGGQIDPTAEREEQRLPQAEFLKGRGIGAFTLGFTPTSVLELSNVAATIASNGVWCPPSPIEEVLDRHGNPVAITEADCEQAVEKEVADALFVGMSKDDTEGTARAAAQQVSWDRPMLGKTGTTQNHMSAGFIGATPQMAGAVLTFSDGTSVQGICDGDPPMLCGDNGNIYGGRIPARTWFATMTGVHEGLPVAPLPALDPKFEFGGEDHQVPNVVGMGAAQARTVLQEAGYQVSEAQTNSSEPRGTVVTQSPRGFALPGDTITISVSTGYVPPAETEQPGPTDQPPGEGGTPAPPPEEGGPSVPPVPPPAPEPTQPELPEPPDDGGDQPPTDPPVGEGN